MSEARTLLADALVHAAHEFVCVAVLMQNRSWEDLGPWCLSCTDSEGCWAWDTMRVLTWQEIIDAKRRYRMRKRQKWARSRGDKPISPSSVVKSGNLSRTAAA